MDSHMPINHIIYLASPYTSDDPKTMLLRASQAAQAAGILMAKGYTVFAPIPHGHLIHNENPDICPNTTEFWVEKQCLHMLNVIHRAGGSLAILMLEGWEESRGIKIEYDTARSIGMDIGFVKPQTEPQPEETVH